MNSTIDFLYGVMKRLYYPKMNPKSAVCIFLFTLCSAQLFAVSDSERQLAELTAQRDKAISDASEPINRRYQAALQDLLRKATAANDLQAAVKIKEAMAGSDPNGLGWRFRGKWVTENKGTKIQFTAGGNFAEFWNGTVQDGHWQAISDNEVKVVLKKGTVHEYILSDDGRTVKRSADGIVWIREN